MPQKTIVRLKVFLCDFPDVPAPAGYSSNFVRDLFFAATKPATSPPPDSSPFGSTVFQFFFASSDGWVRVEGDTTNWAHSQIPNASIPHWTGETMSDPSSTAAKVNYGESWPVVVAETLRGLNLVSANFDSKAKLQHAIRMLPNGLQADRLVFLHSDRAGGGVRRSFGQVKGQLAKMSSTNVNLRQVPGTSKLWNSLWDEGWSGLPDFLCTPILHPNSMGPVQADGTIGGSGPAANALRMAPLSVIFHEAGHLVADFPDLYGSGYEPWGVFDLMGGPAAGTHFPMPFCSYLRHKAGWLRFVDRSRETQQLLLHPFETHNEAYRLTNGAPGSNHFLVIENRDNLHYAQASNPPTSQGRMLLAYRLDDHGRLRVSTRNGCARKLTGVVRRTESYGEAWTPGETIGATPPANQIASTPVTCRNALGELWWTVDAIADEGAGDLGVTLNLRALHLLGDYHRATWEGIAPRQAAVPLALDFFGGATGHVMLQDITMPVQGASGGRALFLHPRWANHGSIRGRYDISSLGGGPFRLHAKLAMPDEAVGSDGARMVFTAGVQSFVVELAPGERKEICVDFPGAGTLDVVGEAGANATKDWVYLLDGWLVPLAPVAYDFAQNAGAAAWKSRAGNLSFGAMNQPHGEVSLRDRLTLHTGVEHAPDILFTHPNWADDGYIEGTYADVPIPAGGAFVRAAAGWASGRTVSNNGALVTVKVQVGTQTHLLIENADVDLYAAGSSDPLKRNDLTLLELPLPPSTWGKKGTFIFRVDTAGSAAQDWVSWPYLALTTA